MRQLKKIKEGAYTDPSILNYLRDIDKYPLLSVDEEVALCEEVKKGSDKAFNKLINANLRFVVFVAKQYARYNLPLEDLISEGNIGLIRAARSFDITRGFRFTSYAVWWIRQSILQAIQKNEQFVKLPVNMVAMLHHYNRFCDAYQKENGFGPSDEILMKELDIDLKKLRVLQGAASGRPTPLDKPVSADTETSFGDFLESTLASPDDIVSEKDLSKDVHRVLNTKLSQQERTILSITFGIGRVQSTLEDAGREIGVTRERARQIQVKAIKKLKGCELLRKYL